MDFFLPRFPNRHPKLEFRSLEGVSRITLYRTFCAAFADYPIRLRLSYARFCGMLDSNCYAPEWSAGAFSNSRLVGVVLNGVCSYEGRLTAYDSGTGVMPRFRRQGVAGQMLSMLFDRLLGAGVSRCLLEVLCRNQPAVRLYRRLGFHPTRELACFQASRSRLTFASPVRVRRVPVAEVLADPRCRSFFDFIPSWQNSAEQIGSRSGCAAWAATADGEIRGFGIVGLSSGMVHLLAVEPLYRRRGVATALMEAMRAAIRVETLSVLNVDARCPNMLRFLETSGFSRSAEQYEMMRQLES